MCDVDETSSMWILAFGLFGTVVISLCELDLMLLVCDRILRASDGEIGICNERR
jgi:hypothetical protein